MFLAHLSTIGETTTNAKKLIVVLLIISVSAAILQVAKQLLAMLHSVHIASDMHRDMLSSLFAATSAFYDTVPVAHMLNRFAGDTNQLDWLLPTHLVAIVTGLILSSLMILLSLAIAPLALLVLLPALAYYFVLTKRFGSSKRALAGITAMSEAPLLSCLQESLDTSGIVVLRAADQANDQMEKFVAKLDAHTRAYAASENYVNRYLDVRASFAGASTVAGIALACVLSVRHLRPELVGLTLLWAFKLTQPMRWIAYLTGLVETGLVSSERIRSYLMLPREGAAEKELDRTLERTGWPMTGSVVIANASLRYRPELPLALRGLSLTVPGGKRVGIVGRTGAGKSSIVAALLRSTELCGGSLSIDGVDLTDVGLDVLRRKVCVLPQAPMLFNGSVRENVDPKKLTNDAKIWAALRRAEAANCVEALGGLDGAIDDCGTNISPGERQLLALARVLCRHASSDSFSLLILDEASSQIDEEIDKKLQLAIDKWLCDVTIMVIAHRLKTVMRCDEVCVVDRGTVSEGPASPETLMAKEGGQFRRFAHELGIVEQMVIDKSL